MSLSYCYCYLIYINSLHCCYLIYIHSLIAFVFLPHSYLIVISLLSYRCYHIVISLSLHCNSHGAQSSISEHSSMCTICSGRNVSSSRSSTNKTLMVERRSCFSVTKASSHISVVWVRLPHNHPFLLRLA